ncbi:MAG: peptidoglycan -binding protein [Roseovarius sp.]|uniref:peptidoglycan -binding protein n=1 Tax=Roseovarius sp. TaxID=1486281 RepID=UPI001B5EDE24|nr:peptidoglycan -binding protein [Roseovarius sp.]MBQ0751834.1 peptidoglycan -binding protein [Roseovarius sp.]MBQ0812029.1 peptidoglycan -binding protein [Roseovarius sp.]
MALSRRSGARFQASIWPGFVDAMTGLLLVLMFVLTIFMMVQFVLREEISGQATKLDALSAEVAALSLALGLEQDRSAGLEDRVGTLTATLDDARTREAEQAEALRVAQGRIASFEEQVAGLLAERETAQGRIADLETARAELLSEQEQLQLALAGLRDEVDAQAEAARLAAARREALEALAADLRQRNTEAAEAQAALAQQLSAEEQARLTEAAAAEALRARLADADAELTAMTLALEEQRKRAEETLTLLAAAETARADLNSQLAQALLDAEQGAAAQEADIARLRGELAETRDVAAQSAQEAQAVRDQLVAALAAQRAAELEMTEAEERAALLSEARSRLAEEAAQASEAQKQQALLNQQVAALRQQLSGLQALLDESKAREAEAEVQLQSLGNELNTALARVAAEERRRRIAEEERARLLEAEKEDLEKYRSEFFGRLRDVLGQQQGVQIVGDRFVFSSEVLFAPGEAELSPAGEGEIAKVAGILRNVIGDIPEGIDWVLQVDGHTDNVPIIEGARFADNWALSQARALSVVRYLTGVLGFPAERLSANGYGEFQPVNPEDTPAARAQNRRIELKLTTR